MLLASESEVRIDLKPLDGLRGICSIVIVIGHFFTLWAPKINSSEHYPAFAPEYLSAVTLFFVISGFTLVQVYDRNSGDVSSPVPLMTWQQQKHFFRKRIARLAPLYYLGLFFGIGPLVAYLDKDSIKLHLPVNLLGLQSIIFTANDWNMPLWTVSAFVFCYLCFPKSMQWFRHQTYTQLKRQAIWLSVLSTMICVIVTILAPGQEKIDLLDPIALIVIHFFAPIRVIHFFIGVIGGYMAKRNPDTSSPTLTAELLTFIYALFMIISILLGAFWNYIAWMAYSFNLEFAIPYFQVVWLISLTSPMCKGFTKRFLLSKPMRFLGDISYAVYCLHFPLFNWCAWAVEGDGISESAVPKQERKDDVDALKSQYYFDSWAIFPILALIIIISTIAHKFFEAPARAAISKQ